MSLESSANVLLEGARRAGQSILRSAYGLAEQLGDMGSLELGMGRLLAVRSNNVQIACALCRVPDGEVEAVARSMRR
jgi:hypothetical protein